MVISMYCPNGRVGKTTTALAFAHAAQTDYGIDTCVLEFDFSPGDIAPILNVDIAKNILDAADGNYDIAIQRPATEEFDVITAGYPDYPEQLKSTDIISIIEELKSRYKLVIIDIQPNFIEQVIDILDLSEKIVLVLNNEELSVTRTLTNIAWGIKSGFMDESKFEILVNKFNKKDKINYITESQLTYPLLTTIPIINDFKGYSDERFAKYMGTLITTFFPDLSDNTTAKQGLFSKLFGKKKIDKPANNNQLLGLPAPPSSVETANQNQKIGNIREEHNNNLKNKGMKDGMLDLTDEMLNPSHKEILKFSKEISSENNDMEVKKVTSIVLNADTVQVIQRNNEKNSDEVDLSSKQDTANIDPLDVDEVFKLVDPKEHDTTSEIKDELPKENDTTLEIKDELPKENDTTLEIKDELPKENDTILEIKDDAIDKYDSHNVKNVISSLENMDIFTVRNTIDSFITETNTKINKLTEENDKLKKQISESNQLYEKREYELCEQKDKLKSKEDYIGNLNQQLQAKEVSYQQQVEIITETKEINSKLERHVREEKQLNEKKEHELCEQRNILKLKEDCIEKLNQQLKAKEVSYQQQIEIIRKKANEIISTL